MVKVGGVLSPREYDLSDHQKNPPRFSILKVHRSFFPLSEAPRYPSDLSYVGHYSRQVAHMLHNVSKREYNKYAHS